MAERFALTEKASKIIGYTAVVVAGAILFVYIWSSKVISQLTLGHGNALAKASNVDASKSCLTDTIASTEKENPSKELFVSCGGFLE